MGLTVTPSEFSMVHYKHDEVLAACAAAQEMVAGATDLGDVTIQIDEDVPTNRLRISSVSPWVFDVQSGAMEDVSRPRNFSELQAKINMSRMFFEATDRADESFGAPEVDAEVALGARGAWTMYCFGRVSRLGLRMHQPRYLYDFRNWLGFSDDADAAFEKAWNGDGLTFADLSELVAKVEPTRTI